MQILRNNGAVLRAQFYVDEVGTDATGEVTYSVTNDRGDTIATGTALAGTEDGSYSFTLSPQSDLDVLKVVWTGTFGGLVQTQTTQVEIIDSFIATLPEIRSLRDMDNVAKYPATKVAEAMAHAQGLFEHYTGRAFVGHYGRVIRDGNGSSTLWLPQPNVSKILSCKIGGEEVDTSGWIIAPSGRITTTSAIPVGTANVDITYEHGATPVPADVRGAYLIFCRYLLLSEYTRKDQTTISESHEGVYRTFATAAVGRPTGLPEVDAVLNRHKVVEASAVGGFR